MRIKLRIKSITHSGRKGLRGTPVDDPKYDGVVGSLLWLNPASMQQFTPLCFYLINNKNYTTWTTSEVLESYINLDGELVIETYNSVYTLEMEEDGKNYGTRVYNKDTLADDWDRSWSVLEREYD